MIHPFKCLQHYSNQCGLPSNGEHAQHHTKGQIASTTICCLKVFTLMSLCLINNDGRAIWKNHTSWMQNQINPHPFLLVSGSGCICIVHGLWYPILSISNSHKRSVKEEHKLETKESLFRGSLT